MVLFKSEDIILYIDKMTVTDYNELAKEFNKYYVGIHKIQLERQPLNCKIPIMISPGLKLSLKPMNIIPVLN